VRLFVLSFFLLAAQTPPLFDEPFRPQFHFTPQRNWMNDPNGLVFYEGEYHLFFQYNPEGNAWGHMSWGHAVSPDLVHWTHLPLALAEENGVMIFSGSAVVDRDNTSGLCTGKSCLVAIYTGHTATNQSQHIAVSNDRGRTWTKYKSNPVLDLGKKDFRDPKVLWHEPSRKWIMTVALPREYKVLFFSSPNLKDWTQLSEFGPAGATGGIWECPDLFPMQIEGSNELRWVLLVNLNPGGPHGGSAGQYFTGRFDGRTFNSDNPNGTVLWLDHGKDLYATVTFSDIPKSDGRRIAIGWLSNWQYAGKEPTAPFRTAQSLPRELTLRRTPQGLRLAQSPVRELSRLRGRPIAIRNATLEQAAAQLAKHNFASNTFEAEIDIETPATAGLELLASPREKTLAAFDPQSQHVLIDRTQSGDVSFEPRFSGRHTAPLPEKSNRQRLRIFVDRSSVELFAAGGLAALSERVFPSPEAKGLRLVGPPAARVHSLTLWPLRSVWPAPR
jgi:fructan beta-fructosidase